MKDWELDDFQPIEVDDTQPTVPLTSRELAGSTEDRPRPKRRRRLLRRGCVRPLIFILVLLAAYFFAPFRTNLLVLGIDRVPEGTTLGRSDTMILASVQPFGSQVNMLSIPRDLWVTIPNYGEQRINAAHYFAEAAEPGSGPQAAMETVRANFGVPVRYYLRVRLEGFADVIDALGGIDISLDAPSGNYAAGQYHFDGTEALAFVRDRTGDDFFRMQHGQVFIVSLGKKLLNPLTWFRLPSAFLAAGRAVDTNLPVWQWPRLGLALLLAGPDGIDTRSLDRSMVFPFATIDGAQVLGPNWEAINPVLTELFGVR